MAPRRRRGRGHKKSSKVHTHTETEQPGSASQNVQHTHDPGVTSQEPMPMETIVEQEELSNVGSAPSAIESGNTSHTLQSTQHDSDETSLPRDKSRNLGTVIQPALPLHVRRHNSRNQNTPIQEPLDLTKALPQQYFESNRISPFTTNPYSPIQAIPVDRLKVADPSGSPSQHPPPENIYAGGPSQRGGQSMAHPAPPDNVPLSAPNPQPSSSSHELTRPMTPTEPHAFASITYKEKMAGKFNKFTFLVFDANSVTVLTMEIIPKMLAEETRENPNADVTVTDRNNTSFSPSHISLLDRMVFTFSRTMAQGRLAAESEADPIIPDDVMTALEVELFCAGVQEVENESRGGRIGMRRYYRIVDRRIQGGVGGIRASHGESDSIRERAKEMNLEKVLIAECQVDDEGFWVEGWWNDPSDSRVPFAALRI